MHTPGTLLMANPCPTNDSFGLEFSNKVEDSRVEDSRFAGALHTQGYVDAKIPNMRYFDIGLLSYKSQLSSDVIAQVRIVGWRVGGSAGWPGGRVGGLAGWPGCQVGRLAGWRIAKVVGVGDPSENPNHLATLPRRSRSARCVKILATSTA